MSEWVRTLVVGVGGFLGASARYALGGVVHRLMSPGFPWATFLVNVSGCFAIGFLAIFSEEHGPVGATGRLFWMVGVLGGYTTFSSFGYETLSLARDGSYALAAASAVGQVALGLAAVWIGAVVARGIG